MEIYLARHTSVDVPRGTCYGFTDVPLRATFRREATATRLRLGGLTFDHVYTIALVRADERLQLWYDDFLNHPTTGGESFRDLYARVAAFLNELRKKDYRRVAVFAHGGVLICAQVYAGAIPLEDGFKHLTSYGGVVKINI